jgi:osmotically-inducible protein OsmY
MRNAYVKFVGWLVGSALLLQLVACIAVPALMVGGGMGMGAMLATDRRTPGAVIEDRGIETKSALRIREALGDAVHVNVSSYNRLALITGEVPDEKRKAQVEKIVLGVENVQKTVNEIAIMENTSTTARVSDGILSSRIRAALIDEKTLVANAFKVSTERGVVYIQGRATAREIALMTDIVSGLDGVTRVVRMVDVLSEEDLSGMLPAPPALAK